MGLLCQSPRSAFRCDPMPSLLIQDEMSQDVKDGWQHPGRWRPASGFFIRSLMFRRMISDGKLTRRDLHGSGRPGASLEDESKSGGKSGYEIPEIIENCRDGQMGEDQVRPTAAQPRDHQHHAAVHAPGRPGTCGRAFSMLRTRLPLRSLHRSDTRLISNEYSRGE